ncbi:hypothetical protein niasHS_003742 [Heterodera schachtii]|uniref:Transmembrane protein n=1 Tax=Heterodera schachtii TaxID=97005 RepID=A0ABD2KHD8_HETSC
MEENERPAFAAESAQSVLFLHSGDWVSARELATRRFFCSAFRLALAVFVSVQLRHFLFSPVWMHGYLWSLNQFAVSEQGSMGADKSALYLLEQQMAQVGFWEHATHGIFCTLAVRLLLHCGGFSHQQKSVWALLRLAFFSGMASGLARAVQMRQRLLPCVHECFCGVAAVFLLGLCLTLRNPWEGQREKNGTKKTQ